MIKIAFAINQLNNGGAERVISILASSFAAKGYDTYLINNRKVDGEYPLHNNVKRFFLESPQISKVSQIASWQRIKRLRSFCHKNCIDVVVSFMGMSNLAILATTGLKTKVIISLRNDPNWLYQNNFERLLIRLLFSFADGAVFQTNQALSWAPQKLRKKATIILNPISSRFFGVNYAPNDNIIVATGRLVKQKNYGMMLRAFAKAFNKHQNIYLKIYGQGPEEINLKKMAIELNIMNNVEFCGVSNKIPDVLAKANLFILSSNVEGLPNGMMEAMSVGVPCISTDCPCGGPELLLGNNERGMLVPINDDDRMAAAICKVMDDNSLKNAFSTKSREYAKRFHVDSVVLDWENYINSIFSI